MILAQHMTGPASNNSHKHSQDIVKIQVMTGGKGIQLCCICFGCVTSGILVQQFRSAGLYVLPCGAGGRLRRLLLRNHGYAEKMYLDMSDS